MHVHDVPKWSDTLKILQQMLERIKELTQRIKGLTQRSDNSK